MRVIQLTLPYELIKMSSAERLRLLYSFVKSVFQVWMTKLSLNPVLFMKNINANCYCYANKQCDYPNSQKEMF